MKKVKRNMPCPCGSGLKYKKCCGNTNANLQIIVERELKQLQKDVMEFAFTVHKETLDQFLHQYSFLADLDESAQKISIFNLGVWGVFSQPLANGGLTIFEDYLKENESSILRSQTKEAIQSWKDLVPALLRVIDIADHEIHFEDAISKEPVIMKMSMKREGPFIGDYVLGFPIKVNDHREFFLQFTIYPKKLIKKIEWALKPFSGETKQFMKEKFPQFLMNLCQTNERSPKAIEWANEMEKETAHVIEKGLLTEGHSEVFISWAIGLWQSYCTKKSPIIKKAEAFAAALEYFINSVSKSERSVSQAKLAKKYGVSASTVSNRFKDIEAVLKEELDQYLEQLPC
ncbi:helix-turn-helix domain-containing protein [Bacillus sp. CLL-7-23]|uniref:Helix-turn-helix domain-containing protein n=1 Tax=Bacillus changyiensis TaxID=3004103 RepID=A0ABT4X287_9BACI|nr:SEC-C metal-binding domain-containing protein [Bacillus changyiensis]MDA7026396.1 helix-turn-helix domain-containing protein [Bacillus changyiensis]